MHKGYSSRSVCVCVYLSVTKLHVAATYWVYKGSQSYENVVAELATRSFVL